MDAYLALPGIAGHVVPGARRRDVLHVAGAVRRPDVAGADKVAVEADLAFAEQWYADFALEIDGVRHVPSAADRGALLETIRSGRLRWWIDGSQTVSMAAHNLPIAASTGEVIYASVRCSPRRSTDGTGMRQRSRPR